MSERKSDPDRDGQRARLLRTPQGPQAQAAPGRADRSSAAASCARHRRAKRRRTPARSSIPRPTICGSRSASAAASISRRKRRTSPTTGFIGCEPYVNGMAKILAQIEAADIGNIRLFAGDAAELLAWLPKASLSRIDLIHPDPWPKRRHWKRRFVQDRDDRRDGARAESRRRIPFRLRHRRLLRLDAVASGALAGLSSGSRSAPMIFASPGPATP